jgi:hypothetical protein
MLSMSVSPSLHFNSGRTNDTAVLDNGTFRDSVFYNLLGEEFIPLAVSFPQVT